MMRRPFKGGEAATDYARALDEPRRSGLSLPVHARDHALAIGTLRRWRRALRRGERPFVPTADGFELGLPFGVMLLVPRAFEGGELSRLLAAFVPWS